MEQSLFAWPQPVMFVDPALQVICASGEAAEYCAQWETEAPARENGAGRKLRLPAEIAAACLEVATAGTRIVQSPDASMAARVDACVALGESPGAPGYLVRFVARALNPQLDVLSPSEGRVAMLVAHGSTNRAVARQLRKSERTVECQLSAIYRKLGLVNRVQLSRLVSAAG